ncbi:MAG TPA: hypothetical protein VFT29_20310 [Gemmatimonadaceae bacterium]|nr:hypothetical protein [Gemmatimonadaceae bacterium]
MSRSLPARSRILTKRTQVVVRHWKNDRIVHERWFFNKNGVTL